MEKTPTGTSVGVDDPFEHVDRCDFVTDDGRCRYAFDHYASDPAFAADRRDEGYACLVVADDGDWSECPKFRARKRGSACVRCGLEERTDAHSDARPLLEAHHLSYAASGETVSHEITVTLCRWCHARVHDSWARLDDDASPVPEAVAEREGRRSAEREELSFSTAAERYREG